MLDDATLLCRYASDRSEQAFTDLVERYLNQVYFAALRHTCGNRQLAEDVAQAVFTRLAHKARSLTSRPSLAGWLYLTTRFEARHAVRGEHRRKVRELEAHMMHESEPENHAQADWERIRPVIDDALCTLPERD